MSPKQFWAGVFVLLVMWVLSLGGLAMLMYAAS